MFWKSKFSVCWSYKRNYTRKSAADQKQQYHAKHNTHAKLKIGDTVLVESKTGRGEGGEHEVNFKGRRYTIAEYVRREGFGSKIPKAKILKTAIIRHWLKDLA